MTAPDRRLPRLAALTCAAAVIAALPVAASAPVAGAQSRPVAAPGHPSQVVLPTGETLGVRWFGGTPRVSRLPGDRSPISIRTAGSHVYAVPVEAVPYLGSVFDRNLFDVTQLAATEAADPGWRIPVSLTFAGAAVSVPGVRIISRSGPHATGYLDRQSTAAFGAFLRARLRGGPAGARTAGTPVAGLTRLALDAPGAGTVQPAFAQVTLTVRLTPPTGAAVLGAGVMIMNMDDSRKYTNFFVGIGPENYAKVSVPKGNYALVGTVFTAAADGTGGPVYIPIAVDYAVRTNNQTVTLDARKATATASYSTPRPADLVSVGMEIFPTDGVRPAPGGLSFYYSAESQVLVQPTPEPKHGVLEFDTFEHRSAAPAGDAPFEYHLTAEWPAGIPADLHRTVGAGDLARIEDRVYGDASGERAFGRGPVYPDLRGAEDISPGTTATTMVDYVYGPPDVKWTASVYRSGAEAGTGNEAMFSAPVSYPPGHSYGVNWYQESLAPGFTGTVPFPRPYCVACRTPKGMALSINSELDADPNHTGAVGDDAPGHSRFQVFQDGTGIEDEADTDEVTFAVPPEAHTYRIEDTIDRAKLGFTTATRTSSVYTVSSSSTSGQPVPAGWQCTVPGTGACTVLPLLTANVPLPTAPDGTIPVGTAAFVVSVGHLPAAAESAISTLTFATSLDGTTFSPAIVAGLGNGRYEVTLTTPAGAAGRQLSIRLHAEDAAGATLTQTVTNAYTVAAT